ncbi:hypothetical protein LPJ59_006537, partial [Coemansia sp. RSA 2399]
IRRPAIGMMVAGTMAAGTTAAGMTGDGTMAVGTMAVGTMEADGTKHALTLSPQIHPLPVPNLISS